MQKEKPLNRKVEGFRIFLANRNEEYEVVIVKSYFVGKSIVIVAAAVSIDDCTECVESCLLIKVDIAAHHDALHSVDNLSVIVCVPVANHTVTCGRIYIVNCKAVAV